MNSIDLNRPRPHSVAIVAMGASSSDYINRCSQHGGRHQGGWDETWAINAMGAVIQHDRLFAMDDMSELILDARGNHKKVANGMVSWLPKHTVPVYVPRAYPEIPMAVEYPIEDVINCIGFPYLNNSVAYAIAFGILLGVNKMSLFGCDFSYRQSNVSEEGRGCVEWLLGLAGSRNINVELSATTTLLDADLPVDRRLYGYDERVLPMQVCAQCGTPIAEADCDCQTHETLWRVVYPDRKQIESESATVTPLLARVVGEED